MQLEEINNRRLPIELLRAFSSHVVEDGVYVHRGFGRYGGRRRARCSSCRSRDTRSGHGATEAGLGADEAVVCPNILGIRLENIPISKCCIFDLCGRVRSISP